VTGHCIEYDYHDGTGFVGTDFNMGPPPYVLEYILRDAVGPQGQYHGNFGKETSVIVDYPFITARSLQCSTCSARSSSRCWTAACDATAGEPREEGPMTAKAGRQRIVEQFLADGMHHMSATRARWSRASSTPCGTTGDEVRAHAPGERGRAHGRRLRPRHPPTDPRAAPQLAGHR